MKHLKGFTLIELMIAVVIIGILSSLAIVNYKSSVQRSYQTTVKSDLESIAANMARFRTQNFSYNGAILGTGGIYRNYSPEGNYSNRKYDLVFVTGATNTNPNGFIVLAKPLAIEPIKTTGAMGIDQNGNRCWNKSSDASCTPGTSGQAW
jgi:type IV pilus assembly protein PilE